MYCQKCGAKVKIKAALNHMKYTMVEVGQNSQQATLNDAKITKSRGLKSIVVQCVIFSWLCNLICIIFHAGSSWSNY